jgi:tRNA(Ile)-lysidine synthase TilS/MesJ
MMLPKSDLLPTPEQAFALKLDLFMKTHVLPLFAPEDIAWWFSVSGGKDSYALLKGMEEWYAINGIQFNCHAFHINQWGGPAATWIQHIFRDVPLTILDARESTKLSTNYQTGMQAPCGSCSGVRHSYTDQLLKSQRGNARVNIVARGLHLSDLCTSLVWRRIIGLDAVTEMLRQGKGQPLYQLPQGFWIAKPLTYIREYESAAFAEALGFRAACCGCPACHYPSRRDIIEETVLEILPGPLWEFSMPGLDDLLSHYGSTTTFDNARLQSAPGTITKRPHLPRDLADFAVARYAQVLSFPRTRQILSNQLTDEEILDNAGRDWFLALCAPEERPRIPTPALLVVPEALSSFQKKMVLSLGPFWGAPSLGPRQHTKALDLQERVFGVRPDKLWGQVHNIIHAHQQNAVTSPGGCLLANHY